MGREVLKGDVLELGVEGVVLVYHLIVFEDLLSDDLLGLLSEIGHTAGYFFSILRLRSF